MYYNEIITEKVILKCFLEKTIVYSIQDYNIAKATSRNESENIESDGTFVDTI